MLIENGTTQLVVFLLVDSSDDETAETGLAPTVNISKNGGTFAPASGAVTEVGNGWYKFTLTATETNTNGPLIVRATGGVGADEWRDVYHVIPALPRTAAQIQTSAQAALQAYNLDHLLSAAVDTSFANTVNLNSVLGHLASISNTTNFDRIYHSLQAIVTNGNLNWAGEMGPSATDVATAVLQANIEANAETANSLAEYLVGMPQTILQSELPATAAAQNVVPNVEQMLVMIGAALGIFRMVITGTTISVYAPDETPVIMQWTTNSATAPTTRQRTL
jgi:hypothetical protein